MTWTRSLSRTAGAAALALTFVLQGAGSAAAECPIPADEFTPDPEFTSSFMLEECKFRTKGENPFFPLRPGWRIVLESDEEVAVVTVLHETKKIEGVRTRVVEELGYERDDDGELLLVERSLNYFAHCKQTGSVFYFGEEGEDFDEDGNVIGNAGAWLHGVNGARAGIIMPGTILVGGGYYEEIAPEDSALDKARIAAIHETCEAGDSEFDQCVETENTQDCSDDEEMKVYAADIGQVVDEDLVITDYGFVDDDDDSDSDSDSDSD